MLEVIERGTRNGSGPSLLFVHGTWHAAWCWDEHFLDFFASKGHHALAVSLRGHGGSPSPEAASLGDDRRLRRRRGRGRQ